MATDYKSLIDWSKLGSINWGEIKTQDDLINSLRGQRLISDTSFMQDFRDRAAAHDRARLDGNWGEHNPMTPEMSAPGWSRVMEPIDLGNGLILGLSLDNRGNIVLQTPRDSDGRIASWSMDGTGTVVDSGVSSPRGNVWSDGDWFERLAMLGSAGAWGAALSGVGAAAPASSSGAGATGAGGGLTAGAGGLGDGAAFLGGGGGSSLGSGSAFAGGTGTGLGGLGSGSAFMGGSTIGTGAAAAGGVGSYLSGAGGAAWDALNSTGGQIAAGAAASYLGGGGGGQAATPPPAEDPTAKLQASLSKLDEMFKGRESVYQQAYDANYALGKNRLDTHRADTQRDMRFSLADRGLNGGSADIDAFGREQRNYSTALGEVANHAQSAKDSLIRSDDNTRLDLAGQIRSGLSAESAYQSATTQQDINLDQAKQNNDYSAVNNYLTGAAGLVQRQQQVNGVNRANQQYGGFLGGNYGVAPQFTGR